MMKIYIKYNIYLHQLDEERRKKVRTAMTFMCGVKNLIAFSLKKSAVVNVCCKIHHISYDYLCDDYIMEICCKFFCVRVSSDISDIQNF